MGNIWTEEQKKVIDLRGRNLLVSAAAGSGKTAVLVERIIQKITDTKNPVDIDRLLIVTFTRVAASEMRERIGNAIRERLQEEPENEHLLKQETLLFHAQITTIDSFCQSVIRSHFHQIGLDPSFSIMDEGERKLLLKDTAEEVLEEAYEQGTEAFHQFVECFASGKRDDTLPELFLRLFEFSRSYPWPQEWLVQCEKAYEVRSVEELESAKWMQALCGQVHKVLEDLRRLTQEALETAGSPEGPYMYEEALQADMVLLRSLAQKKTYRELSEAFAEMGRFAVLSRKKDDRVSEQKKEKVKELRDRMKKGLQSLKEQYFYGTVEEMLAGMEQSRGPMQELFRLTGKFSERFAQKKKEKNRVDFSDLEHMALEILVRRKEGRAEPTETALAYASYFDEIMIDEYQDSNLVQELLLTSVSRCSQGQNNIFMVGDVKQSIYRFRLARPELFMEKYDTYTDEDSPCQKIELFKNFRSRSEVLDCVNLLFRKLMHRDLGNVEYDDRAALYAGAVFPRPEPNVENRYDKAETSPLSGGEILLLDLDGQEMQEGEENDREAEARMIGGKIRELVGRELVYDKERLGYRKARFGDIVVLLRSVSGWAEKFLQIFADMGIPAYTGTRSGYFSAVEVQTVLALLRIMDNPRQEIPFTAVMASPIGCFTTEELAGIRASYPDMPFYEACARCQADKNAEWSVLEKLERFWGMLERFRSYVPYTPMHELLWRILDETGYLEYVSAMPAGGQRRANLEMLAEKAAAYESTSYRGLFHFVRYIESLKKYEVDFGEAGMAGGEEDTVRIMSIHKSKGLEFPVVFVAGLGKSFNQQDSRSTLAVHPVFGVGCDSTDPVLRIKTPVLLKKMIQRELHQENMGEELRVLYVALTRAKEKLYLTAGVKKLDEKLAKWAGRGKDKRLPFLELSGAGSALEWILRAVLCDGETLESEIPITICSRMDLQMDKGKEAYRGRAGKQLVLDELEHPDPVCRQFEEWLSQNTGKSYPGERTLDVKGKVSVSELKKQSQRVDVKDADMLYPEQKVIPVIPRFLENPAKSGTARGSAMHHVLELADFAKGDTVEKLQKQLESLCLAGRITKEEIQMVSLPAVVHFVKGRLGRRVAAAQKEGRLYREKQFVVSIPASDIQEEWGEKESVLVQGIVDAWFVEEDEIILVDYKTDHIGGGQEEILVARYQTQISCYARALEQLTGKKVRERFLYSFALQKEIAI